MLVPRDGYVEIRLGSPIGPELRVFLGEHVPQLGAELIVIQPAVFKRDPKSGWAPVGGVHTPFVLVGRDVGLNKGRFELPETTSGQHLVIGPGGLGGSGHVDLTDMESRNGTWFRTRG